MAKTALVTGAAAGIGKACAKRLARDGHQVGVLDLDKANAQKVVEEIEAEGGKAYALGASIADRPAIEKAVQELRDKFGPVTILVNNAGITGFDKFEEITDELWDRQFEINTKGTFIVTQTVLPDMKAASWGRIVNISSSSAQGGSPLQVHYSASKGAVISFTRSLSQVVGRYGVTVNNIPPGSVMQTVMSEAQKESWPMSEDTLAKSLPVKRTGVPDDIASACSWLCQEDAGYVTGQTIGVNGGRIPS
jgi:2-hydroxycyclohexanecarboxyl-CoA dehydrogenase